MRCISLELFILLVVCFFISAIFFLYIQPNIPSFFFRKNVTETSGLITKKSHSYQGTSFILTSSTRLQTDFHHDHLVYHVCIDDTDYIVPENIYHTVSVGDSISALTNQFHILKMYKKTGS